MDLETVRRSAAKSTKSLYDYELKHRPFPNPKLHPCDAQFYDSSRDELLERGFLFLGDVRDAGAPKGSVVYKTPLRILATPDGRIMATIALLQNTLEERMSNALGGLSLEGVVDLETEFSNGRFLLTSNAEDASLIDFPPQIETRFFPEGTKVSTLLREHRRRVRAYLLAHPKFTVRPVTTIPEYGAAQVRQGEIKAKFKKKAGYVTAREVQRIADRSNEAALGIQAALGEFLGGLAKAIQADAPKRSPKKAAKKPSRRKRS
jgi:hypothetical protein